MKHILLIASDVVLVRVKTFATFEKLIKFTRKVKAGALNPVVQFIAPVIC